MTFVVIPALYHLARVGHRYCFTAQCLLHCAPGGARMNTGWQADPTHRHELRYWNGVGWTEHVSDGGTQTTDTYATPVSSRTAGAWHRDPTGRGQFRYWDSE